MYVLEEKWEMSGEHKMPGLQCAHLRRDIRENDAFVVKYAWIIMDLILL